MKYFIFPKSVLFLIIALFFSTSAFSQTGSCTVLQQPCDSDGVLVTTINSGMTPPLTFTYGSTGVVHSNITVMSDTAYGLPYFYAVHVADNFGNYLNLLSNFVGPFSIDPATVTNPICPDTIGTASVTINSGHLPASVEWFNDLGNSIGFGNPMDLPSGFYTYVVTDSNGCVNSFIYDTINISQMSNIYFNVSTTPAGCTDGTAAISSLTGGIPPYNYYWFNGLTSDSISNLTAGNYFYVTVTDSQGCSRYKSFNITQSINISANSVVTPATCLQNDGSIITFGSGGQSPYSYAYSNGATTQEVTGLTGGNTVYVTVTDANGCTEVDNIYVGTATPITVTYSTQASSCSSPTGIVSLSISGGNPPYSVNWYGYPSQTDTFLTNIPEGFYGFEVTDQNGCMRSGTAHVPNNGNMGISFNISNGSCPSNNGLITVNSYGSYPPFSYQWNTGDTTQTISGLSPGCYTVTITDSSGCQLFKHFPIQPGLTLGFSTQQASCLYVNDGIITANVTGGVPPYTYSWNYLYHPNLNFSFPNTQTISGLYTGYYELYIYDSNGCWRYDTVYVGYDHSNDSCYCTVTGRVFVDDNNNCVYDAGEEIVQHIQIHCDSIGSTFTDTAGIYSLLVPAGNFTLSEVVQYYYPLAPCQNNQINLNINPVSGCTLTYDFANVINPIHDVKIITTSRTLPVIGYSYLQQIVVSNQGTITEDSIQFGYSHDGQLTFLNSSFPFLTQYNPSNYPDWYSISSGFPVLNPGESHTIFMNYFIPQNIPLGTEVNFYDTVAYADTIPNWLNDYTPWNNLQNYDTITLASYDPNYKEVFPRGLDTPGYITPDDSVLTYVIHFENIGNFYADKVVIIDTLDSDLDLTTLRPDYATHNYRADLSEDGILKFTFEHIHLSNQEPASSGFVTYSIKLKHGLPLGTVIQNNADIFFDYNLPISTNIVTNTISYPLTIEGNNFNSGILLYPNPSSSVIWICSDFVKNISAYTIFDLTGRIIIRNKSVDTPEINVGALTNGIYFIEITGKNGSKQVAKFVKN